MLGRSHDHDQISGFAAAGNDRLDAVALGFVPDRAFLCRMPGHPLADGIAKRQRFLVEPGHEFGAARVRHDLFGDEDQVFGLHTGMKGLDLPFGNRSSGDGRRIEADVSRRGIAEHSDDAGHGRPPTDARAPNGAA
jgi:hypothetical protein